MKPVPPRPTCAALALLPAAAQAHFFVQPYVLPVPFSIYAWGASAALAASFMVVGLFISVPRIDAMVSSRPAPAAVDAANAAPLSAGRLVALLLLLLCIVAGFVGSQNPFVNVNMTLFWIAFVLGVPYAVALVGDFYAPLNPWRTLVTLCERLTGTPFDGRLRVPKWVGCLPALLLYMAFIWIELFGHLTPRGLSAALVVYTLVNLGGAFAIGKEAWFRQGEFFSVMMRLIGPMSPWARPWGASADQRAAAPRWRPPFVGLLSQPVEHPTLVLFILFMLSSTAFDGLHSTLPWTQLFWKHVFPVLAPWLGDTPARQYAVSAQVYQWWQWAALAVSPLVYAAVFVAFVAAARAAARSTTPLQALVLRFAMPLVPIAFVYHVSHYYTLLLVQGGQLAKMVSDPFGLGWDLFGSARSDIRPVMIGTDFVWHSQLTLIVAGHIASVYLAHLEALRAFGTPRRAATSQLPMLALMMLFTTLGLWILSLPLASG